MLVIVIESPSPARKAADYDDDVEYDDDGFARKFVRHVLQIVERLQSFPESGRIVPAFADPMIREIIRMPCRIVYRVETALDGGARFQHW